MGEEKLTPRDHEEVWQRVERAQSIQGQHIIRIETMIEHHDKLDTERFKNIQNALEVRRAWVQLAVGIIIGALVSYGVAHYERQSDAIEDIAAE